MSEINPGDVVRVSTSPGFKNTSAALADPTTVTLRWRVAGGVETAWVYGTDVQVVRDSIGLFHADIPVAIAGMHYFRWIGTGAVAAVEEGSFEALPFAQLVRPGMVAIVAAFRRDIGDVGASQVFTDIDLQGFLDERMCDSSAVLLSADAVLVGSPTVYRAPWRWWEASAVLTNGSGTPITPDGDATAPLVGVWAFTSAPGDVYVTGRYFDYWGAAANALETWAARVATQFDFMTDGQQFKRSQKAAGLLMVAREYGRRALVRI